MDTRERSTALDLDDAGAAHDLTAAVWGSWAEAAAVTFERVHARPPKPCALVHGGAPPVETTIRWRPVDDRTRRSHENETDATEAGAYAVATLAVHALERWKVIGRTPTESGADVWMARDEDPPDAQVRLEVSGIGKGVGEAGVSALRRRLSQKVTQLRAGNSTKPGVAAVVSFQLVRVLISERVE